LLLQHDIAQSGLEIALAHVEPNRALPHANTLARFAARLGRHSETLAQAMAQPPSPRILHP
jgi:hypothetical protein